MQKVTHPTLSFNHGIKALDQAGGSVAPPTLTNNIVGFSSFSFFFFNGGGNDNLAPGRPTTQTASFNPPNGAGSLITLNAASGAFVTNGGANLTQRPLGQFLFNVYFAGANSLACEIVLSDENGDDPVQVFVNGTLLFYR